MKTYTLMLFTALLTVSSARAVEITGFGSGEFTFDEFSSNVGSSISGVDSFSFTGDGQSFFAGLLASGVDIGSSSSIFLTATVATYTVPATTFFIDLYDADFDFKTFTGNWAGFTANLAQEFTLTQTGTNLGGGGSFDNTVLYVGLRNGGTGGSASISLDNLSTLSAVPEPSAWAAIFGAAALTFTACRRRRSSALAA